jgi:hypothetical protein
MRKRTELFGVVWLCVVRSSFAVIVQDDNKAIVLCFSLSSASGGSAPARTVTLSSPKRNSLRALLKLGIPAWHARLRLSTLDAGLITPERHKTKQNRQSV